MLLFHSVSYVWNLSPSFNVYIHAQGRCNLQAHNANTISPHHPIPCVAAILTEKKSFLSYFIILGSKKKYKVVYNNLFINIINLH